ncbi:MAG: zinc-dependent metalloprotease [Burkholderiaceae bacterium]
MSLNSCVCFALRPVLLCLAAAGCASLDNPAAAPSTAASVASTAAPQVAQAAAPAVFATPATPAAPAASAVAAVAAAAPAAGASAPAAARPDPSAPKPFDEVIKGATAQPGFFGLWRKDEKLWLEIAPEQLDKPFLLSANISHSVGERRLYGSWMGPSWLAAFRKIGSQQIQLIARSTDYVARGAPMEAVVEQAFSHSLLASAMIASAPHPQRNSILIDASFLLGDIAGYSTQLERAFRLPYGLDRGNSFFEKTRVTDDLTTLNARLHFGMARLPAPSLMPGPTPQPTPPSAPPDARSFFVGMVYSFTKLAGQPMAPRRTDPRLGHFFDAVTDLSTDLDANPKRHYIKRWRLEKKDPLAALSEPQQPIVYWLDKNIPLRYRDSVEAGILEWNKAFERVGFRNAIVVKQQPDDADWDTLDSRHASIRWFTGTDAGVAIGPSHSDPRTGEIIDADIAMSDAFGRGARRFRVEDVAAATGRSFAAQASAWGDKWHLFHCSYAQDAAAEMDFALDLLEARGDVAPEGPEAEAFAQAVVKDTISHEVGHTLGLKHNFKASTVVTRAQLQDREFTEKNGISGSVMDYAGFNVALSGERQGSFNNTTLGPYDYWAIEYAYRQFEAGTEAAELARIAARSSEPALAFADDADAGGFGANDGIDPLANRFDLGDDPLDFYKRRLQLSRELWQRVQERAPLPSDPVMRQRRILLSGFRQLNRAAELVGKYVGGMHTVRDLPGTTSRASYTPVEPTKQREALQFLAQGLFNADSFRFKPQFLASLSPDYNEWERGGPVNIPAAVLQVQTAALDRLLSPGTASRLLDLPLYIDAAQSRDLISLPEVYGTLQNSIWSELKTGSEIDRLRRNLQREHLRRVQALLTRGSPGLPPDALSLARLHATELQAQLKLASVNKKLSIESRAHLQDSLALLTEALRASMQRS